jgi:hypothetical protein
VERALGKLLTDENSLERFFENPEAASWEVGLALSPIELEISTSASAGLLSIPIASLSTPFRGGAGAASLSAVDSDDQRPQGF